MFRGLLEKARIDGHIDLGEGIFLKDLPPTIYTGDFAADSNGSVRYYNSGGRSIIFERSGSTYRIKGVDPFGHLTEKVAQSPKNKIEDVSKAFERLYFRPKSWGHANGKKESIRNFNEDKPFGVLTWKNAENARDAFGRLSRQYEFYGIEKPCEFICHKQTGIDWRDEMTYQLVFELPSLESDFRIKEFDSLLEERLDNCSAEEIAAKMKKINRLYGRFIHWVGFTTGLLVNAGILPTNASFCPQNWVISRHKNGYGIFRVDHTSTIAENDKEKVYRNLMKEENGGLPYTVHNFSVFAERIQVAANPKVFLPDDKKDLKFREILALRKGINADISRVVESHKNIFTWGLCLAAEKSSPEPIPEELFYEALE